MQTAVVILNWNTRELLERFLPPLLRSVCGLDAEVAVADNASADGSVEMLRARFPQLRVLTHERNYGFAEGYDRALAQIEAEYFVLLNSDVEVPEGWLQPLVDYMERHPECGACGPKLHSYAERDRFEYAGAAGGLLDKYGYPFCRGRVLNRTERDCGQYDGGPKKVLWVSGACLLVRSRAFREAGGLDRRFFAHMEEIDLCWKMQLAGYSVVIVPASTVYHIGGATLPGSSPWKLQLNCRNNLLMLENNLAPTLALQYGAERGGRIAARRIFFRKLLDGCAAIVYICTGKFSCARAVRQAHREYRKLKGDAGGPAEAAQAARPAEAAARTTQAARASAEVAGLYGRWIIPAALLRGNRIFELVHRL